jgi:hypothetical protein
MFFDASDADVPIPDALDLVLEADVAVAAFAAHRLRRIDALRRDALRDARVDGRTHSEVILRGLRLELAAAMRVTEYAAATLLAFAEALVHRYPDVLVAFEQARITERHADLLTSGMDELEPGLRERLLPEALLLAETEPVGVFRRSLRRLVEDARSVTLPERHAAALGERRVFVEPAADGMGWLHLFAPMVEIHAAHSRATAMAKALVAHDDDPRTLDQARADVLADLLIDGDTSSHSAEVRGIRASVVVTVPALALLDPSADAPGGQAVVEGVGPVPIDRARELCGGDATWMRVLTHPETGAVLSVGRTLYSPPASLRRLVRWRADRCMAPGCGIPASRCEIDHTLAWEHGGSTSLENLAPLCKGHHTVKHHGGWMLSQTADGTGAVVWTSPAGRTYVVRPERRVPVFRPSDEPPPF